jgi:hypothetical protein
VTRLTTLAVAAVAVVALVALILIMTGSTATKPQRDHVSLQGGQAVRVARSKLGPILVNGQGRTLYLLLKDRYARAHATAAAHGCGHRQSAQARHGWGRAWQRAS